MFIAVPFFALGIISVARVQYVILFHLKPDTNTNIMSEATVSQTGYMMKINLQPDTKTIHITAQTRIIRTLHELYENQAL